MSVCTVILVLFAVLVAGFFSHVVVQFGSLLDFDERFDSLKFVFFIIHGASIIILLTRKLIKLIDGGSSVLWYGWLYGLIINKKWNKIIAVRRSSSWQFYRSASKPFLSWLCWPSISINYPTRQLLSRKYARETASTLPSSYVYPNVAKTSDLSCNMPSACNSQVEKPSNDTTISTCKSSTIFASIMKRLITTTICIKIPPKWRVTYLKSYRKRPREERRWSCNFSSWWMGIENRLPWWIWRCEIWRKGLARGDRLIYRI